MNFTVFVSNSDNVDDIMTSNCCCLRFNNLTAADAETICRLAKNQGYTVISGLRVKEDDHGN